MAISQVLCTSFKKELLEGTHIFGSDGFKIALYTSAATLMRTLLHILQIMKYLAQDILRVELLLPLSQYPVVMV